MFAGIVEKTGDWISLRSKRLTVRVSPWDQPFEQGESIAINGVCLTLTEWAGGRLKFDLLAETLKRTNLGKRRRVNLERSLRLGDTIGGHFVTGHVDGTGAVRSLKRKGKDWILEIACGPAIMACIVEKGSISVDGVSLTIVDVMPDGFTVHLIPHTWKITNFSDLKVGDRVNLENDMIGKYVQRLVSLSGTAR
jgi:riboflavin synthase